jgi:hypothetical protein
MVLIFSFLGFFVSRLLLAMNFPLFELTLPTQVSHIVS